jgi:hypothetical protein
MKTVFGRYPIVGRGTKPIRARNAKLFTHPNMGDRRQARSAAAVFGLLLIASTSANVKSIWLIYGLCLLATGCGAAVKPATPSQAAGSVEQSAPKAEQNGTSDWQPALVDIEGHEHRPLASPEARALALIFIMQDCPIANSYIPEINRLHAAFSERGIPIVLVQVDPQLSLAEAREHARDYSIRPPVVLDLKHDWVRKAGATKTPEAVVFSREAAVLYRGRIDDQYAGFGKRRAHVTSRDLYNALDAIAAGKGAQRATETIGCFIPDLPSGE